MIGKNGIITGKQFNESYQNLNLVGNPTITNGIITGFTTSNYVWTPAVDINSTNWEINNIKIQTSTLDSAYHPVLSGTDKGNQIIGIGVYGSNLTIGWSSNGTGWDIVGDTQVMALTSNTWYNICVTFNGNAYKVYINGELKLTYNSTKNIYNAQATTLYLGIHRLKTSCYNGPMDISQLNIRNNDKVVYAVATDIGSISQYQITSDEFYEL